MTTNHEAVAALPITSAPNQSLLRGLIVGRFGYAIPAAEDPTGFVAVDPATGDVPPFIAYGNSLFWYDAADATTAHDGTSCLVSSDGKRFKISADPGWVQSVLDKDTTAQPASPSIGDAYLIPAAATGVAWAGHDDDIGIFTARGWLFIGPNVGRSIYVEDEEGYYHYTAAGAWVAGMGGGALGAKEVAPANLLHGQKYFVVENQTTATPPGTITAGAAYIIASSPTGAWAGYTGYVAVGNKAEDGWELVAPAEGLTAYDKDTNAAVIYQGSAWSGAGSTTDYQAFEASGTWTKPSNLSASSRVLVEEWDGGGGGGSGSSAGGGGGGAYRFAWFLASELGATEPVTVGAGGAITAAGGPSSFGAHLGGLGGGGYGGNASNGSGGGGGGLTGPGGNGGSATVGGTGGLPDVKAGTDGTTAASAGGTGKFGGGGAGSGSGAVGGRAGGNAIDGGGGGGNGTSTGGNGGNGGSSIRGGGGGAGAGAGAGGGTGGTSIHGGVGGDGGSPGAAPGGGGGANAAGGRGEVRVTTFR